MEVALLTMQIAMQIQNFVQTVIGKVQSTMSVILGVFNKMQSVRTVLMVVMIGKCLFSFFALFAYAIKYFFVNFIPWFFTGFIPWTIDFLKCGFQGMIHLPQCGIWYLIDTALWVAYLPVRFMIWFLDWMIESDALYKIEHDIWNFLEGMDQYIHDPPPKGMGTGFHIIHFPDTVTKTCYSCKIRKLKSIPAFRYNLITKFIECIANPFKWGG